MRWVVVNGNGRYRIGTFDGKTFEPEHKEQHRVAYGRISATQTFNNSPEDTRRRVQMSWLHIRPPEDVPCLQMLSLPVELTLRTTPAGLRLFAGAVREVEQFRRESHFLGSLSAGDKAHGEATVRGGPLVDVTCTLEVGEAKQAGVSIYGVEVGYGAEKQVVWLEGRGRRDAPAEATGGKIKLRILLDTCVADAFVNEGAAWITVAARPDLTAPTVRAFARGGRARVADLVVHDLAAPRVGGTMATPVSLR
jgi:sucrose-6-phosphate hydrolase SacC (GH32 family)